MDAITARNKVVQAEMDVADELQHNLRSGEARVRIATAISGLIQAWIEYEQTLKATESKDA